MTETSLILPPEKLPISQRINFRRSLGKLAPKRNYKLPRFSKLTSTLAPPMENNDRYKEVKEWVLGHNDLYGDCTIVAAANLIDLWSTFLKNTIKVTDDECLAYYQKLSGFILSDPSTDTGMSELDVLRDWRINGFPNSINGFDHTTHSIGVQPTNHIHVKQAIDTFGAVYMGANIPEGWENNQDAPVWDVPGLNDREITGGHAMAVVGDNKDGFVVVTWTELKTITYEAWDMFVDESYALVSPDFITGEGKTPFGTYKDDLINALALVSNQ